MTFCSSVIQLSGHASTIVLPAFVTLQAPTNSLPVGIGNDSKPSVRFLLHVGSNNMLRQHSFQSKMSQLTQAETERQAAGL